MKEIQISKPFHLGFDARMYGIDHAGIGRYVENLVQALIAAKPCTRLTLFLSPQTAATLDVPDWVEKVPVDIRHYTLREQVEFLRILNRFPVDLMHFPHFNVPLFYRRPYVVTIHDILWHQVRGSAVTTLSPLTYYLKYFGYRAVVRHAVTAARSVIVPSHYVKSQLIAAYPALNPARITVTYEGVAPALKPIDSKLVHPSTHSPYIVYTGSCYPHKNIEVILDALTQVSNLKLVVISARNVFVDRLNDEVRRRGLTNHLVFAGRVPDTGLAEYYAGALALVVPSLSEGFGLTGLEAMALKTPVIAAQAGSLPEIYADAALYFDPKDPAALAHHLVGLHQNHQLRQTLIERGLARASQFTWSRTAVDTIKVYASSL